MRTEVVGGTTGSVMFENVYVCFVKGTKRVSLNTANSIPCQGSCLPTDKEIRSQSVLAGED